MHSTNSGIKKFIPWIVILVIVLIFDFIKVLPKTMEWIDAQKQISTITEKITQTRIILKKNEEKKAEVQSQFDTEAKDFVLEEQQIFPTRFSPYDVSKNFELFSIQHSLLSVKSILRIESLSFSGGGDGTTGVMLNLLCTEDTLKRIIEYLQSGNLPEDILDNENLDTLDVEYLKAHKLPLAHINSIRVSKGEEIMGVKLKRIALDILFFVQH